ncbi:MAG: hypothetical protein EAX91_10410 [Candidatus Lokiarchaeota archaeon]|nr:hypothetical protein [Candidatus Lokiarchaeota archaeon]
MNEMSILMHLLSKKRSAYQIGATEEEILDILNVKNKNKSIYFQNLIVGLSNYLIPLGLQIKFNSLNLHWYLSSDKEITELISANPFEGKPSLAATLLCTLTSCLKNSGSAPIQEIRNLRNKKDIMSDLKELEKEGYLIIDKTTYQIHLTPLIGYKLDLHKLLINLSLKLKESKI